MVASPIIPRVAVAEELDPLDAEHLGRRRRLLLSPLRRAPRPGRGTRRPPRRARPGWRTPARPGGPRRPRWASVPPVAIDSSSGWAWKETRVAMRPEAYRRALRRWRRTSRSLAIRSASNPNSAEHLVGVLAGVRRRPLDRAGGAAEPRRRRRLDARRATSTKVPRSTLWGCWGASPSDEHRGEAHVGVLHELAPLVAGLGLEDLGQPLLHRRPLRRGRAGGAARPRSPRPGQAQQLGVELRLDRADRDVLAVGGLVDVVEVGAGVEQVGAPLVVPDAHGPEGVEHRGEHGGAVDHGGVDDLALARALGLEQRADDAEGEEHAAAAEVAHQVERRHRGLARAGRSGRARRRARCS